MYLIVAIAGIAYGGMFLWINYLQNNNAYQYPYFPLGNTSTKHFNELTLYVDKIMHEQAQHLKGESHRSMCRFCTLRKAGIAIPAGPNCP